MIKINYSLKMKMKKIAFILLFFCSINSYSQAVELDNFTINTDNKSVFIDWTLAGGSTCNGIKVYRSIGDTLNFVEIGDVSGVCGSSVAAVSYDYTDSSPIVNQAIFYRLKFGFSQLSEIKTVFIEYFGNKGILISPNPAVSSVLIEFENQNNSVLILKLFNSLGILVYQADDIKDSPFTLNVLPYANGKYIIQLDNGGEIKFKENIIIIR